MVTSSIIPENSTESIVLADPNLAPDHAWTRQRFIGETDYKRMTLNVVPAIRALGRNSASGLYREVNYRISTHPWLEWAWRVEGLQQSTDIRVKDREDFAAEIFLIFGRLSLLACSIEACRPWFMSEQEVIWRPAPSPRSLISRTASNLNSRVNFRLAMAHLRSHQNT